MSNSKQKQASAPEDAPVQAFGLSNEQLRRSSEAMVPNIESRIILPRQLTSPQPKVNPLSQSQGYDECRTCHNQ